jgi:hypothetical protein
MKSTPRRLAGVPGGATRSTVSLGSWLAQRQGLLPDVEHGMRAEGHQTARARTPEQRRDVLGLEQEVDRHGVAAASAPQSVAWVSTRLGSM